MPFRPNPYIIGVPIRDPNKFFGREPEFSDINDSLQNNEQLILLYGQRRIGKSSVIAQIPKKLSQKLSTNEFVFISFDFNSLDFNDEENLSTQPTSKF
jgi:AAA+ ATPase superfamily predicted ATPase